MIEWDKVAMRRSAVPLGISAPNDSICRANVTFGEGAQMIHCRQCPITSGSGQATRHSAVHMPRASVTNKRSASAPQLYGTIWVGDTDSVHIMLRYMH